MECVYDTRDKFISSHKFQLRYVLCNFDKIITNQSYITYAKEI